MLTERFNPYEPRHIQYLRECVKNSREKLSRFRVNYRALIEEFVSEHYIADARPNKKVLVNLLGMAVDIHVMHLAPQRPQITISTNYSEYSPTARNFELAINNDFEEMNFKKVCEEVAKDAWFSVGIMKLHLEEGNEIEWAGKMIDIGRLSLKSVSIDNWVHDVSARKFEECEYMGDLQRMRVSDLKQSEFYNQEALANLTPSNDLAGIDELGEYNAAEMATNGRTSNSQETSLSEYVELWDIFLPREQMLVTVAGEQHGSRNIPLRVVDWKGPKHGPYHMVQLNKVPENIMPASPGMQLFSLHTLVNNLYRKLEDQAKRQKEITAVKPGDNGDGQAVRDADDGEIITVHDPDKIGSLRFGGVDSQNHGFAMAMTNIFDQQAGNLQMLGGLSPSADTLGQEQLLQQQSSIRVQSQKNIMLTAVEAIGKDIAWYRWRDQFYNPDIFKEVPGTDIKIPASFHPQDRLGKFVNFNFSIEPYSMEYMPASAKLNAINQIVSQTVMPMMPIMMEQGITMNVEALLKMMARYGNVPELLEAITFMNGEQSDRPSPMSKESVMPAVTRRENVRINRTGSTRQANDSRMAESLMNGSSSGSGTATLNRPIQ